MVYWALKQVRPFLRLMFPLLNTWLVIAGSGLGALRKVVKAAPEHFLSRPDEDGNTKTLSAGQIHGYTQYV